MHRPPPSPLLAWIAVSVVAGCGARTPLSDGLREQAVDAAVAADASIDAAQSDSPLVGPEAGYDAPHDQVSEPVEPPPLCLLAPAGDPVNFAPSPSAQSYTPSIVAVSAGAAASSQPAHVVATWLRSDGDAHPTTVARDYQVAAAWPDGLSPMHEPVVVGADSHTWNELAVAPGGGQSVSLVWWDDPGMVGRLRFRTLDVEGWTLASAVDLTMQSSEAIGLAGGAGLGHPAGYGGDGYGVIWRVEDYATGTSVPVANVLDSSGQIVMGPHEVSAASATKRTPAITWSGTTYLMATAFGLCEPGDGLCAASSIVITRIRPPSGDAWDDSGVELVQAFPAQNADAIPRRPTMVSRDGKTYVAWFEGAPGDAGEVPMIARVAELNQDGTPAAGPMLVATDAHPVYSPSLTVLPPGVALAWAEDGDPDKAAHEPGASRLKFVSIDAAMIASQYLSIDITRFYSWGSRAAVSLDWPRGLMLVWTGRVKEGNSNQVHAVRVDCQ